MILSRLFPGIAGLAFAVAGCSDPTSAEACNGPLEVGITGTTRLTFTWSPRCGISDLSVAAVPSTPGGADELVWGFRVPERSPLGPLVRYGDSPDRATVWSGPQPLVYGRRYRVSVAYIVGGDVSIASGTTTFVWWAPD